MNEVDEEIRRQQAAFQVTMIASLEAPEGWMEMARDLRLAANTLDQRILSEFGIGHDLQERKTVNFPLTDEEESRLQMARAASGMGRVAMMLHQMAYENALKGLLVLQGQQPTFEHDLLKLADRASLILGPDARKHLDYLSKMNQLGRYRTKVENGQKIYGAHWSSQFAERRAEVDQAIEAAWIFAKGPHHLADLLEKAAVAPLDRTLPLSPLDAVE